MAITFKITEHPIKRRVEIVQILKDGEMVGAMYPHEDNGVKIISAHFGKPEIAEGLIDDIIINDGSTSNPPIPDITIKFFPCRYHIKDGKLVKFN